MKPDTRKISDASREYLGLDKPKCIIPSLGNTALEVYNNALKIDTAGFNLVFQSVHCGLFLYDAAENKIKRQEYINHIPVWGKKVSDEFIINLIAAGEMSIWVRGNGFSKEYHRATGERIPKE